eukprot:TRINITY_DN1227_c0_g1_i1.p1 TRINITY_DN1227_c0_g1~~TRINITY_DN1227_c0_g1_i1.p1  ORF type:complete len:251 (-),score=43.75 TRINITY_DN1227_c0_g1_i1:207-959(-)
MIRRPPRSTLSSSSAASDVYKRQVSTQSTGQLACKMAESGNLAPSTGPSYGSEEPEAKTPYPNQATSFFTLFFRLSCILVYLFCSWFTSNFVMVFVICVLLSAADFWTVKNVSGRVLVGLRWWNYVDAETGENHWVFESIPDNSQLDERNRRLFWGALYITPIVWLLLLIGAILQFSLTWSLVVVTALTMTGSNLVGYYKCQKDHKAQAQQYATNFLFSQATSFMGQPAPAPAPASAPASGNYPERSSMY